jgi:hypothetical protein
VCFYTFWGAASDFVADESSFLGAARGGIAKERKTNTLKIALEKKKKQTEKSDNALSAVYIAITEFSEPKSLFILK